MSEYGASIWADPYRWIPEAARLLRPAERLVFLRNSTLAVLCSPDTGKVLDLIEIAAPPEAVDHPFYDNVPAAWAKQWPAEEIWVAQKRAR